MSCSKPLPQFNFDVLHYLNRDELERFSIVCHPLKNFIDRYFHSKPYRVFDRMQIRGGLYALFYNHARWHPNRADYSMQQFLAGEGCSIDANNITTYYSFAAMLPYLGPTVRIKEATIYVAGSTFSPEQIAEMESISYLWRDGWISMLHHNLDFARDEVDSRIGAQDFPLLLNSPTILQCHLLFLYNPHYSFKDYKVLYSVNIIDVTYNFDDIDPNYWLEFLEQPGVKPVVVFAEFPRQNIDDFIDRISKVFSSAVLPNEFKIVFHHYDAHFTVLREKNNTSGEKLELKKGTPVDYQGLSSMSGVYTLERSSI
ncbi:hypothetical protein DdX_09639 [Ditylenchus destructor]|uniref:F-box domain-containing protein n=1 Tax=Ditylenchus destructor TaxID=166010 RepID=A0AAD4N5V3_9BILA|nr:hypothetical protein DdX_09639 [Ditylenchus destructor]